MERAPTPFAQTARSLLRTTVLGAVDGLLREQLWSAVSMAKVAAASGVSRQTLYNEFGNRDELARAYVLWAADDFLDEIERAVATHPDDLQAALVHAFGLFLELAGEHPMVRALLSTSGADDLLALVASPSGVPLVTTAATRLTGIIATTWPVLPAPEVAATAEVLVRLAISHLTVPTATPAEAAASLALVLAPFLAELAARLEPGPPPAR